MSDQIGTYIAGLFTLSCFSYLFKENALYRYVEHIYVGFGAAHAIVMGWQNVNEQASSSIRRGDWTWILPLALGILLYTRYVKSISHLARIPMAFMMGVAAGVTVVGALEAQFIKQIRATIMPLNSPENVVLVLGTVSTLAFFLFIPVGDERQKPLGDSGRCGVHGLPKVLSGMYRAVGVLSILGRATIMIAFGSSYGYVVMARLSYLVARLQFLLGSCFHVIPS